MSSLEDVAKFNINPINQEQADCMEKISQGMKAVHQLILSECTKSRERSYALQKIEEASLWATEAIARHPNGYTKGMNVDDYLKQVK